MTLPRTALLALALIAAPAANAAPMTAQDLVTLSRVAAPAASPDGKWIVWQQTETNPVTYKRTPTLARAPAKGGPATPIPSLPAGAKAPAFSPDGTRLWFLAPKDGTDQLWSLDLAAPGAAPVQASTLRSDVAGFLLAPDGAHILVWGETARTCATLGCEGDDRLGTPGPGTGRLYPDGVGFVRHWDGWLRPGLRNRAFAFAITPDGHLSANPIALDGPAAAPNALDGDTPTRPDGGAEQLAWAPDSKAVYFVARRADRIEPNSTNLDLWLSHLDGKPPANLTADNTATDSLPAPSPDGHWLAYAAMARPGYESDRMVVMLRNLATGQTRALTALWDRSVDWLAWDAAGKSLLATAADTLDHPLFRIDPATGKVTRLALVPKGLADGHIANVSTTKTGMLFTRDTANSPAEVWLAPTGKPALAVTHANDAALAAQSPVTTTRFHFPGAGGETVWGLVHKPASATGKLPVLLFVHGGPQGSYNDGWSNRWNPRVFASRGYAVVSVDFHGSTGYGQAFTDAINRDWGGKPLLDLQKGLATALAADPALDSNRVCALGASYGGFMMNWIEGKWPDRFKCLVQHDGVFDARAMAYETDELWFDEWEHGGHAYHETPDEFEKWNPVTTVGAWKTPMLVITSENDFRIPYTQGLAAFTALQRRAVPSQLLVFPDESHWVLKPKNSLQWHQTVFAWLDRWLKP
ncbi:MAG: S9 family peptidase [Sphingomonadales bacterium]|nr:S9 family peptidase [Sphingomonadales bacterium]